MATKRRAGAQPLIFAMTAVLKKRRLAALSEDGETRTRTGDTTIFSRVLYQLSYLAAGRDGSEFASRDGGGAALRRSG
jgi:hypothetical protein